jgi:hypothetical protein
MPRTRSKTSITLIEQMRTEWASLARTRSSVAALERVAPRDPVLARLVLGDDDHPAPCPTPGDLLHYMRQASGRVRREESAHLIRVLLREADADTFVVRLLVQALLPGLVNVAKKLRWGQGGEWVDAEDFFGELVTMAWTVLEEWSGQDRPYAVLDLLSAIRCRMRRQLFRAKEEEFRVRPIDPGLAEHLAQQPAAVESDLEGLARILVDLHGDGMRTDEAQVLYAQHVLGYSIAELSALTGRNRRVLYMRRDRGRRRVQASAPDLLPA